MAVGWLCVSHFITVWVRSVRPAYAPSAFAWKRRAMRPSMMAALSA
jgi:hypothetical protein